MWLLAGPVWYGGEAGNKGPCVDALERDHVLVHLRWLIQSLVYFLLIQVECGCCCGGGRSGRCNLWWF